MEKFQRLLAEATTQQRKNERHHYTKRVVLKVRRCTTLHCRVYCSQREPTLCFPYFTSVLESTNLLFKGGLKSDPRRHQTILKRNSKTETTELYSQKVRIPFTSLHITTVCCGRFKQKVRQAQAQCHHSMKVYPIQVQNSPILKSQKIGHVL